MSQDLSNDPSGTLPIKKARRSFNDDVMAVFDSLGGVECLKQWVEESTVNKRIFMKDILPKLITRNNTIAGEDGGPVKFKLSWSGDDSLDVRNRFVKQEGPNPSLVALKVIEKISNGADE